MHKNKYSDGLLLSWYFCFSILKNHKTISPTLCTTSSFCTPGNYCVTLHFKMSCFSPFLIPLKVKFSFEAIYFPAKLWTLSVACGMFVETWTSEQQKSRKAKKNRLRAVWTGRSGSIMGLLLDPMECRQRLGRQFRVWATCLSQIYKLGG